MYRGINKQIIEIKCPENEKFEKIMLFVKPQGGDLSQLKLEESIETVARQTLAAFLPLAKNEKRKPPMARFIKKALPILFLTAAIGSGLLLLSLIL